MNRNEPEAKYFGRRDQGVPDQEAPRCTAADRQARCGLQGRLGAALIPQLTIRMSCRIAVNMAKRAQAARATRISDWLDDEPDNLIWADDQAPSMRDNKQHSSGRTTTLRYNSRRVVAIAFWLFAAFSIISYAAYAHQWSELSALRHLNKATPAN